MVTRFQKENKQRLKILDSKENNPVRKRQRKTREEFPKIIS